MTRKLVLVVCGFGSCLWAMHYDRLDAVAYADSWQNFTPNRFDGFTNYFPRGGDCCPFVSRSLKLGGKLHFWGVNDTVTRTTDTCRSFPDGEPDTSKILHLPRLDNKGIFYSCRQLRACLRLWGLTINNHTLGDPIPDSLDKGDLIFMQPDQNGDDQHVVIIDSIDRQKDIIYYDEHYGVNSPWFSCNANLTRYMNSKGWATCRIVHIPDTVAQCMTLKQYESFDSTFDYRPYIWFFIKCCWHERLGGQAPWTSNPTPYACLNWAESSGSTVDSLVLPRINLAGCSSAVAVWACTTNLVMGGSRKTWVLGSTDDGATWSETLAQDNTDTLTDADMPWATNQRRVRLAWVYEGPIQDTGFWCIDHVRILAKPTRNKDVSVSEIKEPGSHGADSIPLLVPGKTIRPLAIVWNSGRQDESVPFTFKIDGGATYSDTKWMTLYPYLDTCVQFSPWTVTSGTHTAVCYDSLPGDECSANDTVTLSFRAVADTWIQRSNIYGGHGFARGAALATVDSNDIFCAPGTKSGKNNFFAKYIVSADLFYTRHPTIQKFTVGAGLTYPGFGDWIYAVKGGSRKYFWAYSMAGDTWKTLPPTPFKVGNGGALAYGGDNRVYLLRGGGKRDFGRFNCSTGVWSTTSARPPAEIGAGGSLVWTRGDTLYALRGGGFRDFYRYVASTDTWDTCASLPVTVKTGGALAYYPPDNQIYAFVGGKRDSFYAYDIQGDSWSRRHRAPNKVNTGGALAYCNHAIYGGLGYQKGKYFWRYSPPVGGLLETGTGEVKPIEQAAYRSGSTAGTPGQRLVPGELLTFDPTDKYTPRYSPGGTWIAYTADDSARDCIGLYRIPASGGLAQAMTTDSLTYEDPEWASNGAWLVAAGDDGIYKVAVGTPSVRLAEGIVAGPQVCSGDSWILYEKWDTTAHTHHVHRVRANGTGDACLTPSSDEYLEPQPVTQSEFACVKLKGEVYQLSRTSLGQESWLTSDYMHNLGLDISPNRQWLTYGKLDESGFWQVYKMRVDGTQESRVTDGVCDCETPVFSPNGQYIAYTRWPVDSAGGSEYSQVCYKDTNSATAEVALNNPDAERENPSWSPNGQYIIYEISTSTGALASNSQKVKQIGRARTRVKPLSGVEELAGLPRTFALYQNRPNPFGRTTTIQYALPVPSLTDLSIYDATGRAVTRLIQSVQKPGYYSVAWKGTDMRGRSVAAGTYFYVLKSNGKIAKKRMLLVR
jgi:hypothetical protein